MTATRSLALALLLVVAGFSGGCTKSCGPDGKNAKTPTAAPTVTPTGAGQAALTPKPKTPIDCFVFVDADPDFGDAPLTAHFTTEVECGDLPVTYSWNFGDGASGGNEANPTHTYSKVGDYVAVVTVKTENGDMGTDEIDIFVDEPEEN